MSERYHQPVEARNSVSASMGYLVMIDVFDSPADVYCAPSQERPGGYLWASHYIIEKDHVDHALDIGESLDPTLHMTLMLHRERLLGHWLVTGIDDFVSETYKFADAEATADMLGQVGSYLGGES